MRKSDEFWGKQVCGLIVSLSLVLLLMFGGLSLASQGENVQHYKLLSILEYSGQTKFMSEFETDCMMKKLVLSDDKTQYVISTTDQAVSASDNKSGEQLSLELSFIINGQTKNLSATGKELAFLEKVTNECGRALKKVTKKNLAKTWKQGFDFSSIDSSLPSQMRFTLTAMPMKTESLGELIAVRALSEPFVVKTATEAGDAGLVQCRVNCVYVFDGKLENIYLGMSVFQAATNIRGFNEVMQHSVATCKADAEGQPIDLGELGKNKDFARLVSKVGVTSPLDVAENASLPQWARDCGIKAAQMANISSATSCEGTIDPVVTCLPTGRIVELQSSDNLVTTGAPLAAKKVKQSKVKGKKGMFDWFGWNLPTAGVITGATIGIVAGAGGGGGGGHHRSPVN